MSSCVFTGTVALVSRPVSRAPRRATRVVAAATPTGSTQATTPGRRAFLTSVFGAVFATATVTTGPAFARSLEEAEAEKMARKEAVRAAAQASAASGRGASAFADSEYQLSEESKTPNFHTRQEEGARRSGGA